MKPDTLTIVELTDDDLKAVDEAWQQALEDVADEQNDLFGLAFMPCSPTLH